MTNSSPAISVIMPVHNAELFLAKAIDSILSQSFQDFEFIIINDGSSDNSENIILSFTDQRIVYITNPGNEGIVASLNKGIALAKGKYIARMDADDIAFPNRFESQYTYMINNPEIALCGSSATLIDGDNNQLFNIIKISNSEEIKPNLLFQNPFIHPSIMIKKEIIENIGYDFDYQYAEDFFLFTQVALKYKVANIKEPLLYYRIHSSNVTVLKQDIMTQKAKAVLKFHLSKLLKDVSKSQVDLQYEIYNNSITSNHNFHEIEQHLNNLLQSNAEKNLYNHQLFRKAIHNSFYELIYKDLRSSKSRFISFAFSAPFSLKHLTLKQLRRLIKLDVRSTILSK